VATPSAAPSIRKPARGRRFAHARKQAERDLEREPSPLQEAVHRTILRRSSQGYDFLVALVSTRDREGAADALRRHFVNGRLELDEFSDRMKLALQARTGRQLRRALWGLPPLWRDGDEVRRIVRETKRRLVMAVIAGLWMLASLVLLLSFAISAVADGPTMTSAVGYTVAWLVVSALAWHARRRA
jgi:hypothetical protein